MRAFDIPPDQRAVLEAQLEEDPSNAEKLEVWEENGPALRAFLCVQTQWRHEGMNAHCMGLLYPAVESAMRMAGIECTPALFDDLRVMEIAGAKAKNESMEHARNK